MPNTLPSTPPDLSDPFPESHPPAVDRITGLLISSGMFLFYFFFRTSCHTFDSVMYVVLAQKDSWIQQFHAHHLFYHQILFGIEHIRLLIMPESRDVFAWFIFPSALFGGLSAGAVYRLLRLFCSRSYSITGSLASALSFSLVYMSTNVEKYPIALFFLIKALDRIIRRPESRKLTDPLIAATLIATATLIHQASLMFLLVPATIILLRKNPLRFRLQSILILVILCSVLVLGCYSLVGIAQSRTDTRQLMNWSLGYIRSGIWGHGLAEESFRWYTGNLAALIGLHPYATIVIKKTMAGLKLHIAFTVLYIISWFIALAALRARKRRDSIPVRTGLMVWIVSYASFIIWWEPLNTKVAALYVPGIWIFLVISFHELANQPILKRLALVLPAAMLLLLAGINIPQAVRDHPPEANRDLMTARVISRLTGPDDIILTPFQSTADCYLVHFQDRERTFTLRDLKNKIESSDELRSMMEFSIHEMCRTKFRFLVTGRSCDPAGKEDPAPLTFEEIRRVLRPYLDKAKFITDLPDGDRLFELTREQLCPEADTDGSVL